MNYGSRGDADGNMSVLLSCKIVPGVICYLWYYLQQLDLEYYFLWEYPFPIIYLNCYLNGADCSQLNIAPRARYKVRECRYFMKCRKGWVSKGPVELLSTQFWRKCNSWMPVVVKICVSVWACINIQYLPYLVDMMMSVWQVVRFLSVITLISFHFSVEDKMGCSGMRFKYVVPQLTHTRMWGYDSV